MVTESLPIVSVITPTKNRALLLRETILSVIAQSYPYWEMLIIDDESKDNTVEMLQEFSSDKRIIYQRRKGNASGAQMCRNQGIDQAKGKYIIFLDSDDLLTQTCLEKRVAFLSENEKLDFAIFPTIIFGPEFPDYDTFWNQPNDNDEISRFLNWDPPWGIISVIWKKDRIKAIGKFEGGILSFQDIDIHVRALSQNMEYKYAPVNEADSYVREHDSERIGIHCNQTDHLISHEYLLKKIYKILIEKNKLTAERETSLAGFFFRVCSFWVQQNNLKKALDLWKEVSEMKLMKRSIDNSAFIFLNYLSINKKENIPVVSRVRLVFEKLLPPEFFLKQRTWKQLKTKSPLV